MRAPRLTPLRRLHSWPNSCSVAPFLSPLLFPVKASYLYKPFACGAARARPCSPALHRYGLLLKLYLQRCGPHKTTLSRQLFINESLTSIARAVHNVRPKKAEKYNEFVQRELRKLELPPKFSLCHAPKVELTGVVIER